MPLQGGGRPPKFTVLRGRQAPRQAARPSNLCATRSWSLRMDGGRVEPLMLNQNRRSIALLYAARAARGFGDGFAVIILPAYLAEIGFDPFHIGLVATAALLGT